MKFVVNHHYRFDSVFFAWWAGYSQSIISILIEITSILVILQSHSELDVVMNFLALSVISDFDDFFHLGCTEPIIKRAMDPGDEVGIALQDLFKISKTSSKTIEVNNFQSLTR